MDYNGEESNRKQADRASPAVLGRAASLRVPSAVLHRLHAFLLLPLHAEAYRDMPHLCVINGKGIDYFRSHDILKSLL